MSFPASEKASNRFFGKEQGFSLFEFFVIAGLISVVAAVLLDRLLHYQEIAEQAAMEMTVVNMRSGLRLRVADLMMQDRLQEVKKLVNENPVHWLEKPPPNYLGALAHPDPKTLARGNWYFDTAEHELTYLPKNYHLIAPWHGRKGIMRFQVRIVQDTGTEASPPRTGWVKLVQTNY